MRQRRKRINPPSGVWKQNLDIWQEIVHSAPSLLGSTSNFVLKKSLGFTAISPQSLNDLSTLSQQMFEGHCLESDFAQFGPEMVSISRKTPQLGLSWPPETQQTH